MPVGSRVPSYNITLPNGILAIGSIAVGSEMRTASCTAALWSAVHAAATCVLYGMVLTVPLAVRAHLRSLSRLLSHPRRLDHVHLATCFLAAVAAIGRGGSPPVAKARTSAAPAPRVYGYTVHGAGSLRLAWP